MIYYFGLFIFLLGIVLDDIPTHALLTIGNLRLLETNPIYQLFGYTGMVIVQWLIYAGIIYLWYQVVNRYKEVWDKNLKNKKIYDIVLYSMCVILVMISMVKIEVGLNNTSMLMDYATNDARKAEINTKYAEIQVMAQERPAEYKQLMTETYDNELKFGFYQTWFIAILAYLLFKVGVRTTPWGYID